MSGSGDDAPGGRIPKDMKGLLQACIAAGASTASNENSSEILSPERREWLENALEDMSVSPMQRMKMCLEKLKKTEDSDENAVDEKTVAIEELIEWCENMDFAIDFHKIGGYQILPMLLDSSEPEIRWSTLELMAALFQNNPYCQHAALQEKLLPKVMEMLDKDQHSTVRTKALLALSCLCRELTEAQEEFLKDDGFSVLMRAMQSDVEKLKIKAAFMLSSICTDKTQYKDILCDMGMVEQLVGFLQEEHSMFHEHLMSALLTIVRDHPRALQECQRTELRLVNTLMDRVEFLEGKEQFQEEHTYAKELLSKISSPDTEDVMR